MQATQAARLEDLTAYDSERRALAERVRSAVACRGAITRGDFHVLLDDGVVVLRGTARNYYAKQLAQEVAKRVHGVRQVSNEMTVERIAAN